MKALDCYLKPGGRIILIKMDARDANTPHKSQSDLLVSCEPINEWTSEAGMYMEHEHSEVFRALSSSGLQ